MPDRFKEGERVRVVRSELDPYLVGYLGTIWDGLPDLEDGMLIVELDGIPDGCMVSFPPEDLELVAESSK